MPDLMLALDASTTAVGWCLGWTDGDYSSSGVWCPPGKDWVDRVANVEAWLWDQFESVDFEFLAFEVATGNRRNMATNRKLGAVEYVIRHACTVFNAPCIDVVASQVRATGCHKRALRVARGIKGEALDERCAGDEADAMGVFLAALKKMREEQWETL